MQSNVNSYAMMRAEIALASAQKTVCAALAIFSIAVFTGCATMMPTPLTTPSSDAMRALAPNGTLRAAINFGNPILANKNAQTGSRSACQSISRGNWANA